MIKLKQKNWIKRIILMILLSLVLVVNAPQIVNYVAENDNHYTAYAAGADPAAPTGTTQDQTAETMTRLRSLLSVQSFFNKLLWPVLYLIGGLMDNSLLFGGGMGQQLRALWVPIRNIVNIFFVIALVGIALYNILGIGEDGGAYAIKTILPKLIVGIIAVNFSFLGIKVALDAVNIITTAIFALPNEVNGGAILDNNNSNHKETIKSLCYNLAGVSAAEAEDENGGAKPGFEDSNLNNKAKTLAFKRIAQKYKIKFQTTDTFAEIQGLTAPGEETQQKAFEQELEDAEKHPVCDGRLLAEDGLAYFDAFKSGNVALAMAVNMMNVHMMPQQDLAGLQTVDDLAKVAVSAIFGVVMYVLFAASFVALLLVLLARLVVMWLSVVVSPLLIVAIAIPSLKEQLGAINKISEHFVKHLIVPIPIALSLSIGWIMLKAVQQQNMNSVLAVGTNLSMGITVMGMSTLQELIVAVGCVAVIWMGVFTSAEGTIAGAATGWIKDKLSAAGKFLGTAPFKYIPWVPIGGQKYSLGAVTTFVDQLQDKLNQRDMRLVNSPLGQQFGLQGSVTSDALKQATDAPGYIGALRSLGEKVKAGTLTAEEIKRNPEVVADLKRHPEKYGRLNAAIEKYEKAKEGSQERKDAGAEIYRLINEGDLANVGTAPVAAPGAPAAPATPGAKPATPGPTPDPAASKEPSTSGFEQIKEDYYVRNDGEVGKWDSVNGKFNPLAADDKFRTEQKAEIEAAKATLDQRGSADADRIQRTASAQAQAARRGFTSGALASKGGSFTGNGDIFAGAGGVTVVVSDTEVYEVDPASGALKKLEGGAIPKPAARGRRVGRTAGGQLSIDEKEAGKVPAIDATKLTTLRGALGIPAPAPKKP